MTTDTKLNQLIINKLTQEQYDEAKAAGTLSDTELYITDSDDEALTNNNISNCITEIPQDIKLELNNGRLTLKAGSKVYIPNGFESDGTTPKFDEVVIESDIRVDSPAIDEPNFIYIYYVSNGKYVLGLDDKHQCSGTSSTIDFGLWYNTTNNFIRGTAEGEVSEDNVSLPLAIINVSNGNWTSIDQVFNGFGYIGSTVFALPGVKGLIPNGRNEDGSLKNLLSINNSVHIYTLLSSETKENIPIYVQQNGSLFRVLNHIYDEKNNFNLNFGDINYCYVGPYVSYTNGKITSFTPKTVFHALDYNDSSRITTLMGTKV
ncbi:hypothetical protein [Actinobacillus minor]|uniref:hypothetical protein n=1 Tax=Actinobacillus minor TaxID=51047 RepID=UPI0023F22D1D|nr:hypothetical protein [Actinobacillus minor]MDD6910886.1 hypothetical protein [Actinobacillus minor]